LHVDHPKLPGNEPITDDFSTPAACAWISNTHLNNAFNKDHYTRIRAEAVFSAFNGVGNIRRRTAGINPAARVVRWDAMAST
jgi:hypothetical protein